MIGTFPLRFILRLAFFAAVDVIVQDVATVAAFFVAFTIFDAINTVDDARAQRLMRADMVDELALRRARR